MASKVDEIQLAFDILSTTEVRISICIKLLIRPLEQCHDRSVKKLVWILSIRGRCTSHLTVEIRQFLVCFQTKNYSIV